jgi:deoxyribonuclease-4
MRIGAHISIAKGLSYLVERQEEIGGTCGQMFVGSPRTWAVSSFDGTDGSDFLRLRNEVDQHPYAVHATYLVNLASPKSDLRDKSIDCLQAELEAAARLHVEYVIVHPGAHTGSGVEGGIEQVAESLGQLRIPADVTLLLENTAGSGTTLGHRFEELRAMIDQTEVPLEKLGVCIDTCHAHAAGYDLTTPGGFASTLDALRGELGMDLVKFLHLNDSKDEWGNRKDNHEHIGEGTIGTEGFRNVVNADALADLPMVIETPKDNEDSDPQNIDRLKKLRVR